MVKDHEKCGICGKAVGHGRHYPGPNYYCECGFKSSRILDLSRHITENDKELQAAARKATKKSKTLLDFPSKEGVKA